MRKSICAVAAATAAFAVLPAAAGASTVSYFGSGTVNYSGAAGETNAVTVSTGDGNSTVISDPGAIITYNSPFLSRASHAAEPGSCEVSEDQHSITCAPNAGSKFQPGLNVSLNDGNDSFVNQSVYPPVACVEDDPSYICEQGSQVYVTGGEGDDTITGSAADESLAGNTGSDTIAGNGGSDSITGDFNSFDFAALALPDPTTGAGNDSLSGGDGEDYLVGGPGTDSIDGGAGIDTGSWELYPRVEGDDYVYPKSSEPGVTVTLSDTAATAGNGIAGENDTVANLEDVSATSSRDTLTGSNASNELDGYGGDDTIVGNGAYDVLDGGAGADAINSRDNGGDRVNCGGAEQPGTVTGDAGDLLVDCAAGNAALTAVTGPAPVQVPAPYPVGVSDTTKAKLTGVSVPGSFKTKKLKSSGTVPVSFTPNESGIGEADLTGKAKSFAIASKAGDLVLASASKTAKANQKTTLKLKLAKKARKALRKKRKLTLRLAFTDKGGNVTTVSRKIKLK